MCEFSGSDELQFQTRGFADGGFVSGSQMSRGLQEPMLFALEETRAHELLHLLSRPWCVH